MHGIAVRLSSKAGKTVRSKILDKRFPQRNSHVFGHNGLEVGSWFPSRLSAVWHGAHGASQAGITGNEAEGTYSIVVSGGEYDGMDRDNGHTLYYSGSDAHDNTNPNAPGDPSTGTKALRTSAERGNPIRVLRTATGHWSSRPSVGLRYDGLYQIVSSSTPRNGKGGLYEQFKLERLPDQLDIQRLRLRPTMEEIRDYRRIDDWVMKCQWAK